MEIYTNTSTTLVVTDARPLAAAGPMAFASGKQAFGIAPKTTVVAGFAPVVGTELLPTDQSPRHSTDLSLLGSRSWSPPV